MDQDQNAGLAEDDAEAADLPDGSEPADDAEEVEAENAETTQPHAESTQGGES